MSFLFNDLIYRPIYNLLILAYDVIPDFGVAIILVTVLIKAILIPLSRKQIESQKKMTEMQPKIKELQAKYKNNKEEQSKALMELYKTNKANPLSGCLPLIVQLVFLIAIYRVLFNISQAGLAVETEGLYSFIKNPGQINHMFLGIINMSSVVNLSSITLKEVPQIILILAAAVAQYFQSKMMMSKQMPAAPKSENDFARTMSKQMLYLGPLLTLFIGFKFPAGLALYWLVSTGFMIVQQYYIERLEESEGKR